MCTTTESVVDTNTKEKTIPLYKVLVHNDDTSYMEDVVHALMEVFAFSKNEATGIMAESHKTGCALCKVEPLEVAELHKEQLESKMLTATIESA